MKILLVTEKFEPKETQRDGGSRLVNTLQRALGDALQIMQFDGTNNLQATWHFNYPYHSPNRFKRRLANADFIAMQIKAVEQHFTHIIFVHISMQFGLVNNPLKKGMQIITFPMFLTPSYQFSGEEVPLDYFEMEKAALRISTLILTPSYLERHQLIDLYTIAEKKIRVVPRGIDDRYIMPFTKTSKGNLKCCSIGSIKPQKNTLELITLFADIDAKYSNATLQIIGPVQNEPYYQAVCQRINALKLNHAIEFTGYVAPHEMPFIIKDTQLHLSTSLCETFGRSIFETLAAGIPNIVRSQHNAAAEFLSHLPYIRFVKNNSEALAAIDEILPQLEVLSLLATEIGVLYSDKLLSRLLAAEIGGQDIMAISDFDGTLYHKNDPLKTQASIDAFRQFPQRIICSARTVEDLLSQLKFYNLEVDWIIACSGAVVSDGQGKTYWHVPLAEHHITQLETLKPHTTCINLEDKTLQICAPSDLASPILGLRTEIYQDKAFIAHWEASKLHAIHRLLNHIDYGGRVRVFGDGKYDLEMLTYFDGTLVTS